MNIQEKDMSLITENKKAFTLIEMMIVVVLISILTIAMVSNYSNIISKGKETRFKSDLNVIKNAILNYKNLYGRWPENTSEVLNAGLVKFPKSSDKLGENITNDMGYEYVLTKDIRGHVLKTKYSDINKMDKIVDISVRISPPYVAKKEPDTFFYSNFEKTGFKSDIPVSINPGDDAGDGDGTGVLEAIGIAGNGVRFSAGSNGLYYPVNIPKFNEITIEFWAYLMHPGSSFAGRENIFEINGTDPSIKDTTNNVRSLSVYFQDTKIYFEIIAADGLNGSDTPIVRTYNATFLPLGNTDLKWRHYAVTYRFDENRGFEVNLMRDGSTAVATFNSADNEIPLAINNIYPQWDNYVLIGNNYNGNKLVSDVILDNICINTRIKSSDEIEP